MSIPLISARAIGKIPDVIAMASNRSFVGKVFAEADLPVACADNPDTYIPHRNLIHFLEKAAHAVGDRNFGVFLAPHLGVADYGDWGGYLLGAASLDQALTRLTGAMAYHTSHDRVYLAPAGDEVAVIYDVPTRDVTGYRHFAPCGASVIISLIRAFTGADWQPLRIELDFSRPASATPYEDLFGCPVLFDAPHIAVIVERHLLNCAPVSAEDRGTVTYSDLRRIAERSAPRDLVSTVREVIRLRLLDATIGIDSIARHLEMGPRTLQRRLNDEGCGFRSLVLQVRTARAHEMLRETDLPVIDIAHQLGYSSSSHFSRAFRKFSGCLPGEVRNPAMG